MVVAAQAKRLLAGLVTFALLVGSGTVPAAGALVEETEPDCRPADDGTEASICQVPEECRADEECQPPPECEWRDETTVRCEPPDDVNARADAETTETTDADEPELIRSEDRSRSAEISGPAAECRLDEEIGELVCRPTAECRRSPDCRPPTSCEPVREDLYRCPTSAGEGPPDQAREDRREEDHEAETTSEDCQPGPDGTLVCPLPPDCEDATTDRCQIPPECESRDGRMVCTPPEDAHEPTTEHETETGPSCEPGPERGTVVCKPPAECADEIGETERCTPPPECRDRGDGTFLCEIPDRHPADARESEIRETDDGERERTQRQPVETDDVGDEHLFGEDKSQARSQARSQIAETLQDAAQTFRQQLDDMRGDYEAQVDDLRAEYQDNKDQLRQDYEDCRAQIPDDADPGDRNDELRSCLAEARAGLDELKTDITQRHEELKSSFKDKAEDARETACQKAEGAALDAIARHGLFDANPGDLLPERALDLCPSFADFDRGGEDR
jgi:hypothetical protein